MSLHPRHHSVRGKRRLPVKFTSVISNDELVCAMERLAIDVFEAATNNGFTFVEALAAVYLTGMNDAISTTTETET